MPSVTVVGAQWGDEGKGKIVDWLADRADRVVRFQGGHNAGHTLVVAGKTYKLSLLPSGVVRGKRGLIGSGVVVDPWALLGEIEHVRQQGLTIGPDVLGVAETACLILPLHRDLDAAREAEAGAAKIGTTGRGIGPAYEDRVGRRAVRLADLAEPEALTAAVARLMAHHRPIRRGLDLPPVDERGLVAELQALWPRLQPYAAPVWRELADAGAAGLNLLFEGAQGTLLDIDQGAYPFVTSSHTLAGQAAAGSGVGPRALGYGLGVFKAYATRVGAGPFPTELDDADGERLRTQGREVGTVTGRARRCGWFDAVAARQAARLNGLDGVCITKLDVLDGFERIRVCTAYELDGRRLDRLPPTAVAQARVAPVYEDLPGWSACTRGVTRLDDLPQPALAYVRRLEALIGAPLAVLSTGPERDATLMLRDPFA